MKKILFATDFSEDNKTALEFAFLLANKAGAELIVLHTYRPFVPATYGDPIAQVPVETIQTEIEEESRKELEIIVNSATELGITASYDLRLSGVLTGVEELIEEKQIDYLVIGKTGSTGFLEKLLGNNTSDIINNVNVPTFVIPKMTETFMEFSQILYATQLEFDEIEQLTATFDIAGLFGSEVDIVHIEAPNEMDIRNDTEFINNINARFNTKQFSLEKIKADTVKAGLLSAIEKKSSDLLVMASHDRSFFSRLISPGKSQKIADAVNIPLLILRFGEDE